MPVEPSLMILEGLHERWTVLLNSLSEEDLERKFIHPDRGREITLKETMALYAWHCEHHLEHINQVKRSEGWK